MKNSLIIASLLMAYSFASAQDLSKDTLAQSNPSPISQVQKDQSSPSKDLSRAYQWGKWTAIEGMKFCMSVGVFSLMIEGIATALNATKRPHIEIPYGALQGKLSELRKNNYRKEFWFLVGIVATFHVGLWQLASKAFDLVKEKIAKVQGKKEEKTIESPKTTENSTHTLAETYQDAKFFVKLAASAATFAYATKSIVGKFASLPSKDAGEIKWGETNNALNALGKKLFSVSGIISMKGKEILSIVTLASMALLCHVGVWNIVSKVQDFSKKLRSESKSSKEKKQEITPESMLTPAG